MKKKVVIDESSVEYMRKTSRRKRRKKKEERVVGVQVGWHSNVVLTAEPVHGGGFGRFLGGGGGVCKEVSFVESNSSNDCCNSEKLLN